MIRSKPARILAFLSVMGLVVIAQGPAGMAQSDDEAYEHNRQGMIAMSEAGFEEAIMEFQIAAALAKDYQITGRPLIYTPVFMTAWANEKIGRISEACRRYEQFLKIAPPEVMEPTKADHAQTYIRQYCH